ncbi:MAG: hypothetical protein V7L20_11115 [Nostoc sp.]
MIHYPIDEQSIPDNDYNLPITRKFVIDHRAIVDKKQYISIGEEVK